MQGKGIVSSALCGLALFCISAPALAIISACDGWYAEGNIGYSMLTDTNYEGSKNTSGLPYNGNLGYKFMPFFGLEIGYTKYSDTNVNYNGERAGSVTAKSFDLAGKGIIPIGATGFEGFGKVGVQRVSLHNSLADDNVAAAAGFTSGTRRKTGLFVGAGGQYYFTPELAAVVQWQRAQGGNNSGNVDFYSVGVSFIFI